MHVTLSVRALLQVALKFAEVDLSAAAANDGTPLTAAVKHSNAPMVRRGYRNLHGVYVVWRRVNT